MYCITDQHIDYILDDIRRNGIETEDLQFNLLDHICCLAEQSLREGDDFESFYRQTIKQFYTKELRELEEETILLLTFKNYFMMKKIMIAGGALSVIAFLTGSFFKIMHWPGASLLITLGILLMCFIFLPLVFILKAKEINSGIEKLTVAMGTLLGILFCLDVLFTVNHWPGATVLWLSTVCGSAFVFIPLYCFTGLRKPETRVNTILTTIVLVGFTGLLFTMVRLRPVGNGKQDNVYSYVQNEQIWRKLSERAVVQEDKANQILSISSKLKAGILEATTGRTSLADNTTIDQLGELLDNENLKDNYLSRGGAGSLLLEQLKAAVEQYNDNQQSVTARIPMQHSWLNASVEHMRSYENLFVLNSLTQLQIYLVSTALPTVPQTVAQR